MSSVSVVNYGIGNLGSVQNMLKRIGVSSQLVTTAEEIRNADKLILPGVGAFDACMSALKASGMLESLKETVLNEKKPLLGICVGYQMLTRRSDEGFEKGLGWLDAETVRFVSKDPKLKIPHMGWNFLKPGKSHPLSDAFFSFGDERPRAYFVHSYYVKPDRTEDVLFQTDYIQSFASGMARENIMGVQFHPEKSHKFGMQLLRAFAEKI